MSELYDTIGGGYADHRRPDPRIAAAILAALGRATTIVNVGAGPGSYEPADRRVIAVEPSRSMIRQRRLRRGVVQASATDLPFLDAAFDAALAVLTVHHWPDRRRGLLEVARVARRVVIGAYWRRPSAYLDAEVRGAISTFTRIADVGVGLDRLRRDLTDGSWRRRHGDLLGATELDLGYRLVISA